MTRKQFQFESQRTVGTGVLCIYGGRIDGCWTVDVWVHGLLVESRKTTKDLRHVVFIRMTSNAYNDVSCLKAVNHQNVKLFLEDWLRRHVVFTESHRRNTIKTPVGRQWGHLYVSHDRSNSFQNLVLGVILWWHVSFPSKIFWKFFASLSLASSSLDSPGTGCRCHSFTNDMLPSFKGSIDILKGSKGWSKRWWIHRGRFHGCDSWHKNSGRVGHSDYTLFEKMKIT